MNYGYDMSGYTLEMYPSEADLNMGTNIIGDSYTNTSAEQNTFIKFIYSGSGPYYQSLEIGAAYYNCNYLKTLLPDGDFDGDGILNSAEDINGNLNLQDDDSDSDGNPDYFDNSPLSIKNQQLAYFQISPNPASEFIQLNFSSKANPKFNLWIYDCTGKTVFEILDSSLETVDISGLRSGVYLAKITTDGNQFNRKLVIQD